MSTASQQHSNNGLLRAIGFCGLDDSVDPYMVLMMCHSYPIIEFGVLFRPDLEGQPRYPSKRWVEQFSDVLKNHATSIDMKLAAHLCGTRVNDVLNNSGDEFINQLIEWNFHRVQINATARNGVDTSNLAAAVPNIVRIVNKYAGTIEFIIQRNEETTILWEGLEEYYKSQNTPWPNNLSMLYDESKGTGKETKEWPIISKDIPYQVGFAGGLGPHNIQTVLPELVTIIQNASSSTTTNEQQHPRTYWIDMESSLRSIRNGIDIFDLEKCHQVINIICDLGYIERPSDMR
jgi:phosphoribosylanthranilate isomerase